MSWPKTLFGAWLVLRANQVWAPFPDNDPDKARRLMRRFYAMLGTDRPGPGLGAGGRVVAGAPRAPARARFDKPSR